MIEWRSEEQTDYAEAAWESLSEKEAEEAKRAASKAMQLLLYRQRSEKELRQKLAEKEFSPQAADAAVAYVSSYGYLDDRKFAEVYLHSMQGKKSRSMICRELREKGISEIYIEEAFAEEPDREEEIVYGLICKKAGEPHKMEEKELRRTVAYLARKGFPSSVIWKQIYRYQEP